MEIPHTVIVGMQFGDESKGTTIDRLAPDYDIIVRYNGGCNAGHTIVNNGVKLALSQLPSAVLHDDRASLMLIISPGCVLDLHILIKETQLLASMDINLTHRLLIDERCHLVMPYHKLLDTASEASKGSNKIGSLGLGIGFCYQDKTNREGIVLSDLAYPSTFKDKLQKNIRYKQRQLSSIYNYEYIALNVDEIYEEYLNLYRSIEMYIGRTGEYLLDAHVEGKRILFEGAQSVNLDYTYGTYPYTVAYNTIASSVYTAAGIPITIPIKVTGVVRAYSIRVGNGPFPTIASKKDADQLRQLGNEYGTVSKRPRDCGWLDLPLLKYNCWMNGVTSIVLSKLDVLSYCFTIPVCTNYRLDGEVINYKQIDLYNLHRYTPEYTIMQGWLITISNSKKIEQLPANCLKYIKFIEDYLSIPIIMISVGPDRSQVIYR